MDRLLPLVDEAIDRDLAIAVYSDNPVPVLPPQVEIGASLEDLIEWSDYIALDLHDPMSVSLPGFLGNAIQPAARIELLTDLALPCGLGVCGACAVASRHGWKLACQDGPVFKWKDWNR
jgi:dihydroorotate dehydrogenase electron transfer subunit